MNEQDKASIVKNYSKLVEHTNLDDLLPKLLAKNVFTQVAIEKYLDRTRTSTEKKQDLFIDIQRRGPAAFQHLMEAFEESGHLHLHQLLISSPDGQCFSGGNTSPTCTYEHAHPFQLPVQATKNAEDLKRLTHELGVNATINVNEEPLVIQVVNSDRFHDIASPVHQVYPMRSKNRGAVLMINNIFFRDHSPRQGAEVDEKNLKVLFKQLHFHVVSHRNVGRNDLLSYIYRFKNDPETLKADCVIVMVMSHGDEIGNTTVIETSDGLTFPTQVVIDEFDNSRCRALHKKPRIFLFQLCRGRKVDEGVRRFTHVERDTSGGTVIRTSEDMLIGYSSDEGFESHRDIYQGCWYITELCRVIMEHAHNTDFEDMLGMVEYRLRNYISTTCTMQTPVHVSKAFGKCFLNPGIYAESGDELTDPPRKFDSLV